MAKLYTKQTWADEVLAGDERYDILEDNGTPINENVQINLATTVAQAGTAVDADRMNHIEDGLDAVDTRLDAVDTRLNGLETSWINYTENSTIVGWSSFTTKTIRCKKMGNMLFVVWNLAGTSNATTTSFTLPFTKASGVNVTVPIQVIDNGAIQQGMAQMASGATNTVLLFPNLAAGLWTASGTKSAAGQLWCLLP